MPRHATLRDFLIAIGGSGALAFTYIFALRSPGHNVVTRCLHRYHAFWSRSPLTFVRSARGQILVFATLFSLMTVGGLVLMIVAWTRGLLP
jgi:hypothetical protein